MKCPSCGYQDEVFIDAVSGYDLGAYGKFYLGYELTREDPTDPEIQQFARSCGCPKCLTVFIETDTF